MVVVEVPSASMDALLAVIVEVNVDGVVEAATLLA